MKNLLTFSAAAAALCLLAVSTTPASAAIRKVDGLQNGQAVTTELSAHRRRYVRRYYRYRNYYGPRFYYSSPYYNPYYGQRYEPYYYRRPGIYFGFGF